MHLVIGLTCLLSTTGIISGDSVHTSILATKDNVTKYLDASTIWAPFEVFGPDHYLSLAPCSSPTPNCSLFYWNYIKADFLEGVQIFQKYLILAELFGVGSFFHDSKIVLS